MDAQAERIAELMVEACGLVGQAEHGHPGPAVGRDLEHLRVLLVVLSRETGDLDAAEAACSVVADIDRALGVLDAARADRAA